MASQRAGVFERGRGVSDLTTEAGPWMAKRTLVCHQPYVHEDGVVEGLRHRKAYINETTHVNAETQVAAMAIYVRICSSGSYSTLS